MKIMISRYGTMAFVPDEKVDEYKEFGYTLKTEKSEAEPKIAKKTTRKAATAKASAKKE